MAKSDETETVKFSVLGWLACTGAIYFFLVLWTNKSIDLAMFNKLLGALGVEVEPETALVSLAAGGEWQLIALSALAGLVLTKLLPQIASNSFFSYFHYTMMLGIGTAGTAMWALAIAGQVSYYSMLIDLFYFLHAYAAGGVVLKFFRKKQRPEPSWQVYGA